MSGTRREIELVMRVQDLSTAQFNTISAAVKELTANIDKQIEGASKAAISAGELRESLTKLQQAGQGIAQQSGLIDRLQALTKQMSDQEAAVAAAANRLAEYTPKLKANGEAVASAAAQQESLTKALTRQQASLQTTRNAIAAVETQLKSAGINTRDLAGAQEQLRVVAGQVGTGQTALNASLLAYSGNARKAREAAAALREEQRRLAEEAKKAREALEGKSQANQTGIFGLKAYELQNLSYQLNDVATQFASGTGVMQIAAQQSGQILQIFQKNLFELLPLLPKIGAGLAVAGLAFLAFNRAVATNDSLREMSGLLASTVNGVNYSATALTKARRDIEGYGVAWEDTGNLVRKAVEIGLNPDKLREFAKIAQNLVETTGAKFPETADNLMKVFTGPFDGIVKLNQQYGFWNVEQLEANKLLAEGGQLSKAQANATDALRDKTEAATKLGLSPFVQAMKDLNTIYKALLDTMMYTTPLAVVLDMWSALAAAMGAVSKGVEAIKSVKGILSSDGDPNEGRYGRGGTADTSAAISAGSYKNVPPDMIALIAEAAAKAGVDQAALAQLYRNEAVRKSDGSFQTSSAGAQGPLQLMVGTFAEMAKKYGLDASKIADPATNIQAGAYYYREQLDRFKDPTTAAGAYNAGPGNGKTGMSGVLAGEITIPDETRKYIDKFKAGYQGSGLVGSGPVLGAGGTGGGTTTTGSGATTVKTDAGEFATRDSIDKAKEALLVAQQARTDTTTALREKLAGEEAVAKVQAQGVALTDEQIARIKAQAVATVDLTIQAEKHAYAQKEALEDIKSGGNVAKDRAAYEAGVQEAFANGTRSQSALDAAGDKARDTARTARIKGETEILDNIKEQVRYSRFGIDADAVRAAGVAKVNELTRQGITTIETLRTARNAAEDEAYQQIQKQKQLQSQGDSLISQLAALSRGENKSGLQETAIQVKAVEDAYAALFRKVEQYRKEGLKTIGAGSSKQTLDEFSAEATKQQARSVALVELSSAESNVNKIIAERNTLLKTIDDLVLRGAIGGKEAEAEKQKAYDETNKQLLPAIEIWQKVTAAAEAAKTVSGVSLDLIKAKMAQVSVETVRVDDLTAKLRTSIPEAFGSAATTAISTVSTAIGKLATGTATVSDVFQAMGTAALQALADIAKSIAETIIKYEVLAVVKSAAAGVLHAGGVVGQGAPTRSVDASWWAGAPRYHSGGISGLAPNEQAIIAQKGEEILSKSDPRNILNGGASAGGAQPQSIRNILVFDQAHIPAAMANSAGEKVVLQMIKKNAASIGQMIR